MTDQCVPVSEVQEGDMIPALDNAYVFDVEVGPDFRDQYNVGLARHLTCLTCHDQHGDEFYLLLPADLEIEVAR